MPRAPCIACSRCGKTSIAPPSVRPRRTRRVASPISSPGSRAPSAPAPTARPSPRASSGEGSTSPQFFNVQAGDAPYLKIARRHLHDERQLPPGGPRRHRRQPHHARQRRCDLLQRCRAQTGRPAEQPGRSHECRERPCPVSHPLCRKSKTRTRSRARTTSIPRTATAADRQPDGDAAERELRRRFLRPLRRHLPAGRRGGQELSRGA